MSALQTAIEMAPPLFSLDTLLAALALAFLVFVWLGVFYLCGLIGAAVIERLLRLIREVIR